MKKLEKVGDINSILNNTDFEKKNHKFTKIIIATLF